MRHLRRPYIDPVTGTAEWSLVQAPDGGIAGVHSASLDAPLKSAQFPWRYEEFANAKTYADWKFIHVPPQLGTRPPGAGGAQR